MKMETLEQYLARGGKVEKVNSPKYDKELNPGKLKVKAGAYGRAYKIKTRAGVTIPTPLGSKI